MTGWVKLHRELQKWEWYTDVNTCHLFIHLLLKATHQEISWRGVTVSAGQCICGRKELSINTGLSEQQIRTSLNKLKSTKEVTIKTTTKYSIISITNWEKYQDSNQQNNQQSTNNQPTSNHIQEYNNIKTKELDKNGEDDLKPSTENQEISITEYMTTEEFIKFPKADEQLPQEWGDKAATILNIQDDSEIYIQWNKFLEYYENKNIKRKSWYRSWLSWVRKAKSFKEEKR